MLYELRLPYNDTEKLVGLISTSYVDGVLKNTNKAHLVIDINDEIYEHLKGRPTVKLLNETISGAMRFSIVESDDQIELYPCNNYQIMENNGYSFY